MRWWRIVAVPMVVVLCVAAINVPGSASAAKICDPADLEITAKADHGTNWPPEPLGPYSYVRLDVVKGGGPECALPGNPKIQLFGPNIVWQGPSWQLPTQATAESLTLATGDRAYGGIRYHQPSSWGSWTPVWAVVTFAGVDGWVFVRWPLVVMSPDVGREERTTAVVPFKAEG